MEETVLWIWVSSIEIYQVYQYIIIGNNMFGRRMQRDRLAEEQGGKQQACSLSTEESHSPNNTPKCGYHNKEKSELCRKFMEKGFCPYQKKCKFAHGSHQLKRNNTMNSKYKTKECGAFFNQGSCRFGERCNFLHTRHDAPQVGPTSVLASYREVFYCVGGSKISAGF